MLDLQCAAPIAHNPFLYFSLCLLSLKILSSQDVCAQLAGTSAGSCARSAELALLSNECTLRAECPDFPVHFLLTGGLSIDRFFVYN